MAACVAIDEIFSKEQGRFGGDIYKLVYPRSIWFGMVRSELFPAGIGDTINNLTQERAAPTGYGGWANVTFEDGKEGGACLPPVEVISTGETIRNYSLQHKALESTDFCTNNLRGLWELNQRVNNHKEQLANYSRDELEFRFRHEYLRMTAKKVVIGAVGENEGTGESFNGIVGTCPAGNLSQGILDKYKLELIRNGAAGFGMENGAAQLTLVTDAETSESIKRISPQNINELLYGKPAVLLAPYGVGAPYKGFYHVEDLYPIRYTCSGGVYTEVFPFINTAATKGQKSIINPDWASAPYTTSHIFDPDVMINRVPAPITSVSGGLSFGTVNYLGEWKWVNEYERKCNPDRTIGHFRGVFMMGTEAKYPNRGVSFVHLRCPPPRGPTSCPTGS